MSTLPRKNWHLIPPVSPDILAAFPEMHPAVVQYLHNHGINTQEKIDEFVHPDYALHLHDPFLFRDMQKAVDRIFLALEKKERVVIYGDYDGDGICGSGLLYQALTALGFSDMDLYLPHRMTEGYGLNSNAIKKFGDDKRTLLLTVDCGSTNVVEISLANSLGIDVIVADHHVQPKELPPALAIINPAFESEVYPWKNLCGGGTAFKLVQALFKTQAKKDGDVLRWEKEEKWLLDLVAIATVMDMIPLIGESRTLVKYGMIVLKKTRRLGLLAMYQRMSTSPDKLDTRAIGFQIGPRLNAAGRMQHASIASRLLLTNDAAEANNLADELEKQNSERQKRMGEMIAEAQAQIGEITEQIKILTAIKEGWEAGIVGLVAGRIMEQYGLPTMIMGIKEGGEIIGSGRSLSQFNITAALQQCGQHLSNFGGHPQACGFTLKSKEDLEPFLEKMRALALEQMSGVDLKPKLDIERTITLGEVGWELVDLLQELEPFGYGAPNPLFVVRGVRIIAADLVGADGKHLRLTVEQLGVIKKVIAFGFGEAKDQLLNMGTADIVFEIGVNQWNGNKEIQLKLVDVGAAA